MFPQINVNTISPNNCKRVVLFHYNNENDLFEFRHYGIRIIPAGVNRNIKKIILNESLPELSRVNDIAEYILNNNGASSESEGEENNFIVPATYGEKTVSNKNSVRLTEIGPRMTLKLVKIEKELLSGDILFHAFHTKSEEDNLATKQKVFLLYIIIQIDEKKKLKEERKRIQEENVRKKKELKAEKKKAKKQKIEEKKKYLEVY